MCVVCVCACVCVCVCVYVCVCCVCVCACVCVCMCVCVCVCVCVCWIEGTQTFYSAFGRTVNNVIDDMQCTCGVVMDLQGCGTTLEVLISVMDASVPMCREPISGSL